MTIEHRDVCKDGFGLSDKCDAGCYMYIVMRIDLLI